MKLSKISIIAFVVCSTCCFLSCETETNASSYDVSSAHEAQTKFLYYEYSRYKTLNESDYSSFSDLGPPDAYPMIASMFQQIHQKIQTIEEEAIRFALQQTEQSDSNLTNGALTVTREMFLRFAGINSSDHFMPEPNCCNEFLELERAFSDLIANLNSHSFQHDAALIETYFSRSIIDEDGVEQFWAVHNYYLCPTSLLLYKLEFTRHVLYITERNWRGRL